MNNILLAQQLAIVLTNENPSSNRTSPNEIDFDPMIYDRIIDFYFTAGNLKESRNLLQKLVEKDKGLHLTVDRIFQYQNGINNVNNFFKDAKRAGSAGGEEAFLAAQSSIVDQDQLLQETIYSFMLGISACETKDEIQQLFLSTAELLKKIENYEPKVGVDAVACFLVAKYSISRLGEEIDNIEIYNCYILKALEEKGKIF